MKTTSPGVEAGGLPPLHRAPLQPQPPGVEAGQQRAAGRGTLGTEDISTGLTPHWTSVPDQHSARLLLISKYTFSLHCIVMIVIVGLKLSCTLGETYDLSSVTPALARLARAGVWMRLLCQDTSFQPRSSASTRIMWGLGLEAAASPARASMARPGRSMAAGHYIHTCARVPGHTCVTGHTRDSGHRAGYGTKHWCWSQLVTTH